MEKHNVLVLGGTGAIGAHLVNELNGLGFSVVVTSRSPRASYGNVSYVQGDAHDVVFLEPLLKQHYVAIVNFMTYRSEEFETVAPLFLNATDQYFFLSSCRSYSGSNEILSENAPQWVDVCRDEEYLKTDNYALAKARQERVLINSGRRNWTIVRPYLTYSEQRLQLGFFEQNAWLLRAMKGKTIVFSEELANRYTTLTYGQDVARSIAMLIGREKAFGEAINITCPKSLKWADVLGIYVKELENILGKRVGIKMLPIAPLEDWPTEKWTFLYDRNHNRMFSNEKLKTIIGDFSFVSPEEGLTKCIRAFIEKPNEKGFSWAVQASFDRITEEWEPYSSFLSTREYVGYLKFRLLNRTILNCLRNVKHAINKY